jgi:NADPH:quinone reductase-like Zn-dependent oxidoreductase
MRALVLDAPGAPDALRITELPRPSPGPHEDCVNVVAVGLNPVDLKRLNWAGHPGAGRTFWDRMWPALSIALATG